MTFSVSLDDSDVEVFLAMMQALACSTPDALLRVALWNQANLSEVAMSRDTFALGLLSSRRHRAGRSRGPLRHGQKAQTENSEA